MRSVERSGTFQLGDLRVRTWSFVNGTGRVGQYEPLHQNGPHIKRIHTADNEFGCGAWTRTRDHRINNSAFVSGHTRISPFLSMLPRSRLVRTRAKTGEVDAR